MSLRTKIVAVLVAAILTLLTLVGVQRLVNAIFYQPPQYDVTRIWSRHEKTR